MALFVTSNFKDFSTQLVGDYGDLKENKIEPLLEIFFTKPDPITGSDQNGLAMTLSTLSFRDFITQIYLLNQKYQSNKRKEKLIQIAARIFKDNFSKTVFDASLYHSDKSPSLKLFDKDYIRRARILTVFLDFTKADLSVDWLSQIFYISKKEIFSYEQTILGVNKLTTDHIRTARNIYCFLNMSQADSAKHLAQELNLSLTTSRDTWLDRLRKIRLRIFN